MDFTLRLMDFIQICILLSVFITWFLKTKAAEGDDGFVRKTELVKALDEAKKGYLTEKESYLVFKAKSSCDEKHKSIDKDILLNKETIEKTNTLLREEIKLIMEKIDNIPKALTELIKSIIKE